MDADSESPRVDVVSDRCGVRSTEEDSEGEGQHTSFSLIHTYTYMCITNWFKETGTSPLNVDKLCVSDDGPGQETFTDEEAALPPDLEWLEELYEWVFLAFLWIDMIWLR